MTHLILSLIFIFLATLLRAQGIFRLDKNEPRSFKFEMVNNAVLVPVVINNIPFTFLLDTGVKETLLFAMAEDTLYLHNQHKVTFRGLGEGDDIEGLISTGNTMEVGNVAIDSLHAIYVVQANDFDIASDLGTAINGILGTKFFHSFPVRMEYTKSRITVFPPEYDYRKLIRRHDSIAVQVENERAYIQAAIVFGDTPIQGKFLVDMGNTDPVMIFPFALPDFQVRPPFVTEYLGRGINGPIHGQRNRAKHFILKDFKINQPIVSYPDTSTFSSDRIAENRIGSIGNQVLQRFDLLFDYAKGQIYLRKNRWFKKPFLLNMAGMDVKHDGLVWEKKYVTPSEREKERPSPLDNLGATKISLSNDRFQYKYVLNQQFRVAGIREDSPADRAGVQQNDEILKINGRSVGQMTLAKLMNRLQSKPGEEVRLEIRRNNEIIKLRFRLEDPIPFLH